MKKSLKKLLLLALVLIFLFVFNLFLNWTYYNPAVVIPLYGWLDKHGLGTASVRVAELGGEEEHYPFTSIAKLQSNFYSRPRAAVIGVVTALVKAPDGDIHLNIYDEASGRTLVAEMVPEHPLPLPAVGQKIKIWGVTRFDLEHRWWELHPVFGWERAEK